MSDEVMHIRLHDVCDIDATGSSAIQTRVSTRLVSTFVCDSQPGSGLSTKPGLNPFTRRLQM